MKILIQDKSAITETRQELWVTRWTDVNEYMVMHNAYMHGQLGLYKTKERSIEVLADIFNAISEDKTTFAMPEK
jgi:hypothetical protein